MIENKTIKELLKGEDLNSEYALAILSDYIWEIGNIKEIKNRVSDDCFTLYIISNAIGNYQSDGWLSIIKDQTALLPHIPAAMEAMGCINIARTISALIEFMKPYMLENDWVDNMSDSTHNFFIGYEFADDRKTKIALCETSRALIKNQFNNYIHQLDELSEKIWNYGCADNEGWGYPIRLLNKIVEQKKLK